MDTKETKMDAPKIDESQMKMPTLDGSILISPGAAKRLAEHNISLEWLLQKHAKGHFACKPGGSYRDADGAYTSRSESDTFTKIKVPTPEGDITIIILTDKSNLITLIRLADELEAKVCIVICPCAAQKILGWMTDLYGAIKQNCADFGNDEAKATSNISPTECMEREFTIGDGEDILKGFVFTSRSHQSVIYLDEDAKASGYLPVQNAIINPKIN